MSTQYIAMWHARWSQTIQRMPNAVPGSKRDCKIVKGIIQALPTQKRGFASSGLLKLFQDTISLTTV